MTDRETALRQLQEIRREILEIHGELEICQAIQKQVEELQNEKEKPSVPSVPLKPENTADALKQSFERQNRERLNNGTMPKILPKIVAVSVQAVIAVLLALDVFGHKGLIIPAEAVTALNSEDSANGAVLFAVHLLAAMAAVSVPLFWDFFRRRAGTVRKTVFGTVAVFFLLAYAIACQEVGTFAYLILLLCGAALALAAGGTAGLIQKIKMKSSKSALSSTQKAKVAEAAAADERAKSENARLLAETQSRMDEEHRLRISEIDREIREKAQQFDEARQRLNRHMEQLDAMDALCDDDKTLQIVDLLIRFIQTRRADSVKEALQEYDKLMANRQLLEIEKQKLAAELQRASQEHADRMKQLEEQRRHQSEMEYLAWDSAQSRAKIAGQLDHLGAMIYYDLHY